MAANGGEDAAATAVKPPMERFKESVDANPLDFNSWVQLLALVETEPGVSRETVETTFDRFLQLFPLCFGYWNKYAQYEMSLGRAANNETPAVVDPSEATGNARAVYERGVVAARHSVQMWQKYCEFLIDTVRVTVDEARTALEGAVAACANDPLAGPLWDMYIQLETINNDMLRLNQVFKRIMHQPLSNLDEFWEKYNQFVLAQQLHVLATSEELNAMGAGEEMDEGLLRVKIVNSVEAIKNKTLEGIQKRQGFEAAIDRNYFHVTPVSDAALANWHSYLDYEEVIGDTARCELLYERCLISCANYEQLWVRFANWKERVQGFEAANAVFQRAVNVFLKFRASIYLEYAAFLEANGKLEEARMNYLNVLNELAPKLAEAYVRYANFERRQNNIEAVKNWYERGLEQLVGQPDAYGYVAVSYVTFVHQILSDFEQARSILERATAKCTGSIILWVYFIQFEVNAPGQDRIPRVSSIFDKALAEINDLSNDEKNDLWLQYGEFMETYSSSIADVRAVYDREVTWRRKNSVVRDRVAKVLSLESTATSSGYDNSAEVGSKRPRYDTAAASASTGAATPSAAFTSMSLTTPAANGTTTAATNAAYAQYYQQYQAYGAQAYGQTDATQAAGGDAATNAAYAQYQQQYAAYYQQQQQQQQQ
ncbi:hypothetical protein Poli38472_004201 [Pythium oligandrum]|uniref:Pre-mRNA-processing factor 39 n=1 Tax=Pythium oligandrum TaxID=41045 RepID=A0A8K1FKU6_PYTOL|nr:hypothetical protein Poli38472_004201 [Pythium oligandrum]|eukprot:TMW66436.1 hypothetical protein Poli38472_004201 [Pythium oligandrum]